MRTIAVIPARSGSRGIPGKNLRLVGGKSLVARISEVARSVAAIERVVVSTDSRRIAAVARRAGAEAPFVRPEPLANDEASTVDVVRHAVHWIEQDSGPVDFVVTLQPTSPFCRADTVRRALEAVAADPALDSATTVAELGLPASVVGVFRAERFESLWSSPDARRQASPRLVRLTGAVYVSRRGLLERGKLLGDRPAAIITSGAEAIDVDDLDDLAAARRAHRRLARARAQG